MSTSPSDQDNTFANLFNKPKRQESTEDVTDQERIAIDAINGLELRKTKNKS